MSGRGGSSFQLVLLLLGRRDEMEILLQFYLVSSVKRYQILAEQQPDESAEAVRSDEPWSPEQIGR